MAKKRRTYSKAKNKKKKASPIKKYFFLAFLVVLMASAFYFKDEIKIAYYKIRSTYISYQNQYTSKTEQAKIDKIIKQNKDKLFGIDISHYQGLINWDEVVFMEDSIPIDFVMIRATAGHNKEDNYFSYNWREAKNKKIIRGAYHYYRPNENSTEQANNFINKVKLEKGDFPPVLDIEEEPVVQSIASLRNGIQNWLDLVEAHYGVKPIIYTGDSFYKDYLKGEGFEDYSIWIANYNRKIKHPKAKDWIIWQFSDQGNVKGIGEFVDLNVLDGNDKMLKLLLIE